jgi:hypothetical protein
LHHDRVAVSRALGDDAGAIVPAAPGYQSELLAHLFRHLLEHDAGDDVVDTSGKHDDDAWAWVDSPERRRSTDISARRSQHRGTTGHHNVLLLGMMNIHNFHIMVRTLVLQSPAVHQTY